MAGDPLDDILGPVEAWKRKQQTAPAAEVPKADILDDVLGPIAKGGGGAPEAYKGSITGGMLRQALDAGTFHLSRNFQSPETLAQNEAFQNEHPWLAMGGQAAGVIVPMLTPAGWVARGAAAAPRVASAARWLLPYSNFARATEAGAGLGRIAHQSGMGALKTGMLNRVMDPVGPQSAISDFMGNKINVDQQDPAQVAGANAWTRVQNAGDLKKMALDYGVGAPLGVAGTKVAGGLGNAADSVLRGSALGARPGAGARLDLAQALGEDAPGGARGVPDLVDRMRELAYGTTNWRQPVLRQPANAGLSQEIARQYQTALGNLQPGQTARDAEDVVLQWLQHPQTRNPNTNQPYSLVNPSGRYAGQTPTQDTMRGWVRDIGADYQSHNPVHSYLGELAAHASGGEAPATADLMRRVLNLGGAGEARSTLARGIRARQGQIGPAIEGALEQHMGNGSVRDAIAEHVANRGNANALYGPVMQEFAGSPEAQQQLQGALDQAITQARSRYGADTDDIAQEVLKEAGKFQNTYQARMQIPSSTKPLTSSVSEIVKDADGKPIKKIVRQIKREDYDLAGQGRSAELVPGQTKSVDYQQATSSLDSFIRRRSALRDLAKTAARNGEATRAMHLGEGTDAEPGLLGLINRNVRGLADQNAPAGSPGNIFAKWVSANDQRNYAAQLQQMHDTFLGLNLMPQRGKALVDMESALRTFRGSAGDPAMQDMARRGVMSQIAAKLKNQGQMHDVAKIFSNRRTQEILQEIIGPEATNTFSGFVSRAGLASRSFAMDKGSKTAQIGDKGGGWSLAKLAGAMAHFNPIGAIQHAGEWMGATLQHQKMGELARLLGTGTHNPAEFEAALQAIRRAAAPGPAVNNLQGIARTVGGTAAATRAQQLNREQQP